MNRNSLLLTGACVMTLLLTACKWQTVYNHYEHTPIAGWEKNDTLTFCIGPLKAGGEYIEEVGLRISSDYPFTGLNLIVEQTVTSGEKNRALVERDDQVQERSDTLTCSLVDQQGRAKGRGISHYQYLFHLTTLKINEGDMLYVAIRHDMKREILPGIADIGVKLTAATPLASQASHPGAAR